MARIVLTLGNDEQQALLQLAQAELRTPRDQARFVLRQELKRLGLLSQFDNMTVSAHTNTPIERITHDNT